MRIALYIVTAAYALLSAAAAATQLRMGKSRDTSLVMLGGGVLLLAAVLLDGMGLPLAWAVALGGGAMICAAALVNGKRAEFHALHHVVRAILTAVIVLGLAFL